MADQRGELRQIAWSELCPWLILFRTFRISVSLPALSLATAGALLTPLGWLVSGLLFVGHDQRQGDPALDAVMSYYEAWPRVDVLTGEELAPGGFFSRVDNIVLASPRTLEQTYRHFTGPWRRMLGGDTGLRELAWLVFGSLWTLLVWSFFGGAITRIAAVQLGREERISFREAIGFARRKLMSYFLAPIFPLFGLAGITLLTALLVGLPMAADLGVIWAGIVWILVLIGALISTIVSLGVLVGWPLMAPAISSEGSDHFDAFSRAFSYPFQRPLHYLFYAIVAAILGAAGLLLVWLFSNTVVYLGYWSASWGSDFFAGDRMDVIALAVESPAANTAETIPWPLAVGTRLMGLSVGLVRAVAAGYMYSFFWCAATAIYLLLRRDVDHADFDEVFVEDDDDRYSLPPLARDEAGVPGAAEPPGDSETTTNDSSPDDSPPDHAPPDGAPG